MSSNLAAVALALVALGLLLFRELGPVRFPTPARGIVDVSIILLMVALFAVVLELDGLIAL
jgi:hypothetical protein